MRIRNEIAFVDLEEEDDQFLEDISYRIRVSREGFIGEATGVYITLDRAKQFIADLEGLERNKLDRAKLENLSSGTDTSPLDLQVRQIDTLGHLVVEAIVRKLVFTAHKTDIVSTAISFELDREFLAVTILNFKQLLLRG